MMNNSMGGRQGFYQDDNSRSGGAAVGPFSHSSTSSSCSSSPSAASSLQHHQKGVPLSYSFHHQQQYPRGPTPTPWDETGLRRCYSGGGGGGRGANSSQQLHDHLMMTSIVSSSSPGTTNINNINVDDADHHHEPCDEQHLFIRGTPRCGGGGGESSSEVPSGGGGGAMVVSIDIEREHMFDKVVTPSDVGKLNRLVIPKQHAEKYFPLDSSTNEKGLLLNFEDRNGKPWRFRYSYWNSSQSYVMTKGWSRFVKEKKLDAGDIVSFQRGLGEIGKDRLFIDWRRRPDAPPPPPPLTHQPSIPTFSLPHHQLSFHHHPWNHPFYLQHQPPPGRDQYPHHLLQLNSNTSISNPTQQYNYQSHNHHHHLNSSSSSSYGYASTIVTGNPCSSSIIYLNGSATTGGAAAARLGGVGMGMGMGMGVVQMQKGSGSSLTRGIIHQEDEDEYEDEDHEPMVFESVPVVQGKAAAKRLRLFGVNMDCPISEDSNYQDDHCDILSSTAFPPAATQSLYTCSSVSPLPLNLRPYGITNMNGSPPVELQTMPADHPNNKGKASMSLDLDI